MQTQERVLAGRYRLVEELGRGGSATVHRAHDEVLGRDVAVKLVHPQGREAADPRRIAAEGRALAQLSHPNLVTVHDTGVEDGQPYLVVQLVRGETLEERARKGALGDDEVARIGAQVAAALSHLHSRGMVHRDVKPSNVLLEETGRALLTDLGTARVEGEEGITGTGLTIGTAAYLAPEQVRGEDVTPATDVYALGLTLLECLTGRREYGGPPAEAALARLTRNPDVPAVLGPQWGELLTQATAFVPRERPGAEEVQRRLGELEAPGTTKVLPAGHAGAAATRVLEPPAPEARRSGGRQHLLGALLAVVALVLVGVLALGGESSGTDEEASVPPAPALPGEVGDRLDDLHEAVEGR